MIAAQRNCSHVARILLNRGANVSIAKDGGVTALHISAKYGNLGVTLDLVTAGADLEAQNDQGSTPLHLAAMTGHSKVIEALIAAGAVVDSRSRSAETPLFLAARQGHLDAAKEMLSAGANALLSVASPTGFELLPLDVAAKYGHSLVVRELIEQRRIEGCGGASGGVDALQSAAENGYVDIMELLMDSGVKDTGKALVSAAGLAREAAVKLLLQRRRLEGSPTAVAKYVNSTDRFGSNVWFRGIHLSQDANGVLHLVSPRMVQLLIDAGADTTTAVRSTNATGGSSNYSTPLGITIQRLHEKKAFGNDMTVGQLQQLEAIRRLLLRVDAVRAVSWLWHTDTPIGKRVERDGTTKVTKASTTLKVTLPALRRRSRRHGMVLAPLFRHSTKMEHEAPCDEGGGVGPAAIWRMLQQCSHM